MSKVSDFLDAQGARAEVVTEIERELFEMIEARIVALETPAAKSKPVDEKPAPEPHAKDAAAHDEGHRDGGPYHAKNDHAKDAKHK